MLTITAVGLIYNITGAVMLAQGLASASDQAIAGHRRGTFASGPQTVLNLCQQRVDARFGLPVFAFGFVLQLLPAMGVVTVPMLPFMLLALLGVVALYFGMMREVLAFEAAKRIEALFAKSPAAKVAHAAPQVVVPLLTARSEDRVPEQEALSPAVAAE
jgi:hypothetical protein